MNTKIEVLVIIATLTLLGLFVINRNKRAIVTFFLSILGVLLFEFLFDPLVMNNKFHSWTYIFHDVCFILTLGWVCIITASSVIVNFTFKRSGELKKFLLTLCMIDVMALPAEVFLVYYGFRTYSPGLLKAMGIYQSFLEHDNGLIPVKWLIVPPEFIVSIPLLFGLILSFVKYWEYVIYEKK
ncbi:hypothetical protein KAJ27_06895 [bacterium]|nr:hypothetical protein [bacterium]